MPDDAPTVSISAVTAASGTLRIEVSEAAAAGGCVFPILLFIACVDFFFSRLASAMDESDAATAKLKTKIDQAVFFGDRDEARRRPLDDAEIP
jgi:hypothetical protein